MLGFYIKARNTRLEMTADLQEKDQHFFKSTSMKQQENPADFSSVHKVQALFAQICCHFTPCISRLMVHIFAEHCVHLAVCSKELYRLPYTLFNILSI